MADALGAAFSHIPDKKQVWEDLHKLTKDKDIYVQQRTAKTLGSVFSHIPDKKQAWEDLHQLTQSKYNLVRLYATKALCEAFNDLPDKKQAWDDLHRLTSDTDRNVRASAYNSLGKASIFKAANAENSVDFNKEMEAAIGYFDKSLQHDTWSEPAKFCLPFYRSFYALTFKKKETEAEVQKYIAEAKSAVEGSEIKEKLLEAIENLGNALKEAQKARDFDAVKSDLNAYRRYCDRACELLDTTEEKAPGASRVIRRGLPIIDERIKGIIAEIQEKAKALCKETQGTPLEDLGKKVNKEGQNLLKVDNPIALYKAMDTMQILLSSICTKMPEEEKGEACELLKRAKDEQIVEEKINLINIILSKFSSQRSIVKIIENFDKKLNEMIISLKPGISEELTITVGAEFHGTGLQHVITIPLQEISYSELKEDLEKISEKGLIKLATLPIRLAKKIKDYLIRNKKDELLEVI
ncbi:MAG: hypothetical protein O8C64_02370 [Candidatus Methanoperedens sp.]|nr:hypothetical protein [Candidatus Methanoperedens sp.]MCZ7405936.1 hypothetical protein [Candidatus Methanoperedens sp.]